MLIDLNGKPIKYVQENSDLKDQAEKNLIKILDDVKRDLEDITSSYTHFTSLYTALSMPVSDFKIRLDALKTIIKTGVLETEFLGIAQTEDYSDMRKDLLKEMMFFIDNEKNQGDEDEPF